MTEGIPSNSAPRTMSGDIDNVNENAVLMHGVIEKMRQDNIGEEALSDKELTEAAETYISQMHEKGTTIDVEQLPVKDMISARKGLRSMSVPIVSPTGEVMRADSDENVREVITEHNKENRDN
ncbi:MAG TPA: hypothetical protein ENJ75_02275 [Candidatus Kaiserbacteria bacterium]|nr:hypothetical protein [Candidatus Kaiserbacteria bacterium]